MNLQLIPDIIRVALAVSYFTSVGRSVLNFSMMRFRHTRPFPTFWLIYFVLNLTFNSLMSLGLVIMQAQFHLMTPQYINLQLNWLFILPIIGHFIMLGYTFKRKHQNLNANSLFLIARTLLMISLLPIPGNYLWSPTVFNLLFILFNIVWVIASYYYVFITINYLSTHFTDFTKLRAFDLFPHGLVITNQKGEVLTMNPTALGILSDINQSNKVIMQILESFDGKYQKGDKTYRINRLRISDGTHQYLVWDLVDITQLIDIQSEIDKGTASIKGAWSILRNILHQLKQSIHQEEKVRLQQHMHDVLGEAFSVMSYRLQSKEGQKLTDLDKAELIQMLDKLFGNLEDRATGGSDNSFQALQQSFHRIGVNIHMFGQYPQSYHYRNLTYQILREAASNALKHGAANQITLNMTTDESGYHFSITNNGKLIALPNEQGLGLRGMRRIVNDFGGTIKIDEDNQYRIDVNLPKNKKEPIGS